jgi:hypothetical protein
VQQMRHECPRCGFETSHDRWWDRHPALAVLFALPAGYTLIGVMLVYPWFTIPATIIVCAVLLNVTLRRRAAVAARADWDYREEMLRATRGGPQPPSQGLPPVILRRPSNPAPWHVVTQLPTHRFRRAPR